MTNSTPATLRDAHRLDRRALLGRSAAFALFAGVMSRSTSASTPESPLPQDDEFADLVAGNTAFAIDLYQELRDGSSPNLLFSPYSVSLALAMAWAGARGETAEQMAATMAFALPEPELHEAFGDLNDDLVERGNVKRNQDKGQEESGLRIANALWGEQSYPFRGKFAMDIHEDFGLWLELTDFVNDPEGARDDINTWVEDQTEDRIQDIVPKGAVDSMTKLVLANAIYFYGPWQDPYESADTEDDTFHLLDGTTADVPFMYQRESFPYAKSEGMQILELPYANDGFAMTIMLPDEGEFEAFEEGLDADAIETAIGQLAGTDLRLYLPRFEFDFSASLAQTLQSMGMTDAFSPDQADFSGMVEGDPSENLFIGDVLHKAFISVDEEGTEAAAATVVVMPTSAAPPDEEPIEVRIDRPFLFAIRDTQTGTLLFLGRVMNPGS